MHFYDQLLHVTTRIVAIGDNFTSVGTGFFMHLPAGENRTAGYLVTNKHVISGAKKLVLTLTRRDEENDSPRFGDTEVLTVDNFPFFEHPDKDVDLAAIPIFRALQQVGKGPNDFFYRPLGLDHIPKEEFFKRSIPIESILMIGYPQGLSDGVNNLPLIRRGTTASHIARDFNGKTRFAIDCGTFRGSSGSPVFVFDQLGFARRSETDDEKVDINLQSRAQFIGVLFGGPAFKATGDVTIEPLPTRIDGKAETALFMHLGYCEKATSLSWLEGLANDDSSLKTSNPPNFFSFGLPGSSTNIFG